TVNPDEAVSLGAAIHANSITENNSSVFLIDVVPLTLGVETFGGLVDKIVLRNTPIPTVERREYTTYADNQTGMKFKVVQGESPLSDECNILANFELRGIPPMPAGRARIIVEFSVDVNGLLNVTAFEKTTGIKQVVTVEASNNLSFEEMSQDLENAYKKKSENEEKAHLISLRLEMYRLVKFWKTIISEIPTDAQTIASTKINSIENHLQNENFDINEVMKLRTETENIFSAFLDEIINNHLCGKKLSEVRK
ncbi:MAG: Hsp70 family protein, partial [Alphaproteobacteria bacterium]|nr:Hsp70 family protein [Alphaproteobacteria bacterium]